MITRTTQTGPLAWHPNIGNGMAKGHLCPICNTHTVQPKSTNKMQCTSCKTIFEKSRITG